MLKFRQNKKYYLKITGCAGHSTQAAAPAVQDIKGTKLVLSLNMDAASGDCVMLATLTPICIGRCVSS